MLWNLQRFIWLCIAELFRLYCYQEINVYFYIDNLSINQNYSHFMLNTNYVIIFHFCFTWRLSQVHKLLLLFLGALYVWAWRKWRCSLLAWATFLCFLFFWLLSRLKSNHKATPSASGILAAIYDCRMHETHTHNRYVCVCVKVFMIDGHACVHSPQIWPTEFCGLFSVLRSVLAWLFVLSTFNFCLNATL